VLVLPALFQGAHPQQPDALPAKLRELGFHLKQAYAISEGNWDADLARLIKTLVTIPDDGAANRKRVQPFPSENGLS
jgi:hypothetical protein